MMYPFITLDDDTEIVHSEMREDGTVKVYMEKPVEGGFHSATCILPNYVWSGIEGYSEREIERYADVIRSAAHLIIKYAQHGGYANAANF